MNTVSKLRSACAAILNQDVAAFTIGGVDMFLIAANNALESAQLEHNFEATRLTATLDIDGKTGGLLANAVLGTAGTAAFNVTAATNAVLLGNWTLISATGGTNSTPVWCKQITGVTLTASLVGVLWYILPVNDAVSYYEGPGSLANPAGNYIGYGTYAGKTATVTYAAAGPFSSIKEVVALSTTRQDGNKIPLDFTTPDIPIERDRYEIELSAYNTPETRYPSDAQFLARGNTATITLRNGVFNIYPLATTTYTPLSVNIEGYGWLLNFDTTDYVTTIPKNFIVEHGFSWLMWTIVLELNYIFQRFVPRQEGVSAPPEKAQAAAWRQLVIWDTYQIDSHATRSK